MNLPASAGQSFSLLPNACEFLSAHAGRRRAVQIIVFRPRLSSDLVRKDNILVCNQFGISRESDGKASAVHFYHFDFTPEAIAAWKSGEGQAMVVIDHPAYGHAALVGKETREFLARECF